jgi:hypothetical protein
MILLSENKDFEYWCETVPKDAEEIRLFDNKITNEYDITFFDEIGEWGFITIGKLNDPEILGVVGESLSEDQAYEMIEFLPEWKGYKNYANDDLIESLPSKSVASKIESKGVKEELKKVIIKVKK